MPSTEFVPVSRLLFELISIIQGFFFLFQIFLSGFLEYEKCFDTRRKYDTKEILLLTFCFVKTILPFSLGIFVICGKLKSSEHSNIMQMWRES